MAVGTSPGGRDRAPALVADVQAGTTSQQALPLPYDALFALTPAPLLVLTPDLVIREANHAYAESVSRPRQELVGRYVFDVFPVPDDPEGYGMVKVRASMLRACDTGRPRIAETLQRSLLTGPRAVEGLLFDVVYQPAQEVAQVGGDWYDAFEVGSGSTVLVIGDVAGHDQDAAATMAQIRNLLHGIAQTVDGPPAAVLAALDHALHELDVPVLASVVLAEMSPPAPADGTDPALVQRRTPPAPAPAGRRGRRAPPPPAGPARRARRPLRTGRPRGRPAAGRDRPAVHRRAGRDPVR